MIYSIRAVAASILILVFSLDIAGQGKLREAMEFNGEAHVEIAKNDIQNPAFLLRAFHYDDHYHHPDSVRGVVTPANYYRFIEMNIPYRVLSHPNKGLNPLTIGIDDYLNGRSVDCGSFLDAYPTYDLYEQLMQDFAAEYPDISRFEEIAVLPGGRRLLALVITDNPDSLENEPRFLYTSTMHGDETAGYILMLRLIRDLLCNYGSDEGITHLIDNIEIWVNPLANPDGTYAWGNNNLGGARRTNANFVDLNRNYLDPDDGENPDGNPYQPETMAFMELADSIHFDMSSNLHGGVEVVNYPWDTWSFQHADDDWWMHVCRQYADTAQVNSPWGYFNFLDNGITNGYDWYPVAGGRQDYMTYFHRGREMTLELSDQKFIPSSQFDDFWGYNRSALYNYLEQSLFGLRGVVTDAETGEPISANVFIATHDMDNSDVFSRLPHGNYHRYLHEGTYQVTFSADGYISQTVSVDIANDSTVFLNIGLEPENPCEVDGGVISTGDPVASLCGGDGKPDIIQVNLNGASGFGSVFGIVDQENNVISSSQTGVFNVNALPSGIYRIKHMSYAQGVNPAVSNASELQGCYDLSNSIFFSVNRVNGGTISTDDVTTICGDDGIPSVLNFNVTGEEGQNGRWVVLNADFTQVMASANAPNFNFDDFLPGLYRVLHVAYASGVNLGEVDPQNPVGCLNVSNKIAVSVENCSSSISVNNPAEEEAIVQFTPLSTNINKLELLDVSGRLVSQFYSGIPSSESPITMRFELKEEWNGVYILRLSDGTKSEVMKLIIR